MKVSLKEARRIERRIQEKALRKGYPLRSSLNIYDHVSVQNEVKKAAEAAEAAVINTLDLIFTRSKIRRLIQITNENSGINSLIAKREKYIRILSVWEDVVGTYADVQTVQAIKGGLDTKLARAQNGTSEYSAAPNKVEFVAIAPEFNVTAEENVQTTQRNIDNCDDELLALNALTKIEIPSDVYQTLTKNGVV